MTVRVVVADDNYLLREGLERLLATVDDLEVVASVGDHDSLLAAVDEHRPDAVLADIRMPPTHTDEGVRAALAIRASHPETGVVMLSQHASPTYAATLLGGTTNGIGYLLKDRVSDVHQIAGALRTVATGGSVVDPLVVQELIAARRVLADSPLGALTEREQEVLAAMAEGLSNAAIATRTYSSERTVEKHIATIFTKLELANEPDTNRRVKAVLVYLTELSR
jgi:DNA-binding NarL/FixJ family response regulator